MRNQLSKPSTMWLSNEGASTSSVSFEEQQLSDVFSHEETSQGNTSNKALRIKNHLSKPSSISVTNDGASTSAACFGEQQLRDVIPQEETSQDNTHKIALSTFTPKTSTERAKSFRESQKIKNRILNRSTIFLTNEGASTSAAYFEEQRRRNAILQEETSTENTSYEALEDCQSTPNDLNTNTEGILEKSCLTLSFVLLDNHMKNLILNLQAILLDFHVTCAIAYGLRMI
uniref:Uncharacterized protein n=1 Tax=Megaselia scalaris TaxID=36166 RepID=T1GQ70_MEGSC